MKSGFLHRSLPFVLMMALLAGVVACSRTPQADVRLMDSAEAVMESAPDSALALIERVDSAAVRGRADRARYALLRSMALDRNYIDTTDLSILQPAIDYYPKHGTPDQRLKT